MMGRYPKGFLDLQLANNAGYSTTTTTTWQPPSHLYSTATTDYISPLKLAPREEITRVSLISLQHQRYQEQHTKALVNRSTIPGFKTSAGMYPLLLPLPVRPPTLRICKSHAAGKPGKILPLGSNEWHDASLSLSAVPVPVPEPEPEPVLSTTHMMFIDIYISRSIYRYRRDGPRAHHHGW